MDALYLPFKGIKEVDDFLVLGNGLALKRANLMTEREYTIRMSREPEYFLGERGILAGITLDTFAIATGRGIADHADDTTPKTRYVSLCFVGIDLVDPVDELEDERLDSKCTRC